MYTSASPTACTLREQGTPTGEDMLLCPSCLPPPQARL
jgi:hypothetical protein